MNLHRVGSQPDWAAVPPSRYNCWQRLAARTNGVITPGNFFTVLGFCMVLLGLILVSQRHYVPALLLVIIGRLCDIIDGSVAEATGTKSPLGEVLDPTVDKLLTAAALIVLVTSHIVPLLAAILIAGINIAISAVVARGVRRQVVMHTSQSGKISMALTWIALFLYVIADSFQAGNRHTVWRLANGTVVVAMVIGCQALYGYTLAAKISQNTK